MTPEEKKEYNHKWYLEHKKQINERSRKYREKHKEELKEYLIKYYQEHKEQAKELNRKYREKHKEELKEYNRQYHKDNLEKLKELNKKYYEDHKERIKQSVSKYRKNNPDKIKAIQAKQTKSGINAYNSIQQRCNNPNNHDYHRYGGKGIKCLFTRQEFLVLYFRTDNCELCGCILTRGRDKTSRTIDRIDPAGNYEASNCRIVCRSCNSKCAVISIEKMTAEVIIGFPPANNF